MEKNIVNVYKYYGPNNKKSFLYSIANGNGILRYSYYSLTEIDNKPNITRLDNAIRFLQANGLSLQSIQEGEPDYEEFITLLSSFIRVQKEPRPIKEDVKSLTHIPKYSIKYPQKKK